jgi:uncharacterized protein YcbK (DUF882 family)
MLRRDFLKASFLAPALFTGVAPLVYGADFWSVPRALRLKRPATGEEVFEVYWQDGKFNWPGYLKICRLLRDVRADKAVQIDPVTLDIMYGVQGWLKYSKANTDLLINSGYRSPKTNAHTEGAAFDSLHVKARAVDLTVPGVSSESVGRFGAWLRGGGVGFYTNKQFTHLDSGRLRSWRG